MVNLITTISKYLLLIFIGIYAVSCFNILKDKPEKKKKRMNTRQIVLIFIVHFIGYLVVFANNPEDKVILFYGAQVIFYILVLGIYPAIYPRINKALLNNMCMLLTISFIILVRLNYAKCVKQFQIVAISVVITMVIPLLINKVKIWDRLTWVYCGSGIFLLGIVLVLAITVRGAKLSLGFGGISIQPAEFVKILFIFFVAGILSKPAAFKTVVIATAFAAVFVFMQVLATDLGSALIFFLVYLFMLYIATKKSWYLFAGLGAGSAASILAYHLFSHIKVRVTAWKDPWSIINGKGYQITQALFAIGTGSWFGTGLYQGMPNSIPVVEKDFVFAAIAEEMGGFVSVGVIMICLCCFMIFIQVAMMQKNNFFKLIAVGIGISYTFQVFLTVGGAMKMIPLTGVTLPLVSYGGSSALSTLIMFAIIQGLNIAGSGEVKENERQKTESYEESYT